MNVRKLELLVELLKSMNDLQDSRKKKKRGNTPNSSGLPNDPHATSDTVHTL